MYKKIISNGYVIAIGENIASGVDISREEYSRIMDTLSECPIAPEGYYYRLKEDLSWELASLPPVPPEPSEEAEAQDYEQSLERLGVEI